MNDATIWAVISFFQGLHILTGEIRSQIDTISPLRSKGELQQALNLESSNDSTSEDEM